MPMARDVTLSRFGAAEVGIYNMIGTTALSCLLAEIATPKESRAAVAACRAARQFRGPIARHFRDPGEPERSR